MNALDIKIKTEFITLGQFLKYADLINTGGQAKLYISSNEIQVNDEVTLQRGKKLYPGDIIQVDSKVFKILG